MCEPISASIAAGTALTAVGGSMMDGAQSRARGAQQAALNQQTELQKVQFDRRMGFARDSDKRVDLLSDTHFTKGREFDDRIYGDLQRNERETFDENLAINRQTFDRGIDLQQALLDETRGHRTERTATGQTILREIGQEYDDQDAVYRATDTRDEDNTSYNRGFAGFEEAARVRDGARGRQSSARIALDRLLSDEAGRQDGFRSEATNTGMGLIRRLGTPAMERSRVGEFDVRKDLINGTVTPGTDMMPSVYNDGTPNLVKAELEKELSLRAQEGTDQGVAEAQVASYDDAWRRGGSAIDRARSDIDMTDLKARLSFSTLAPQVDVQRGLYENADADVSAAWERASDTDRAALNQVQRNRSLSDFLRGQADRRLGFAAKKFTFADDLAARRGGVAQANVAAMLQALDAERQGRTAIRGRYRGQERESIGNYGKSMAGVIDNYYGRSIGSEQDFTGNMIGASSRFEDANRNLTNYKIQGTVGSSPLGQLLTQIGGQVMSAGVSRGVNSMKW